MLAEIRDKALNSKRLGRDEGRWLLTEAPLLEVGALASEVRFARIPDKVVTFVIDSNPNYTNVCVTDCQFCAFYRKPGDPEAYTLTVEEVLAKVAFAAGKGATTVLLQGGAQPGAPARVLHHARARDAPTISAGDAPFLHRLRDPDDRRGEPAHRGRRARPPLGGRAADAPGRRRRGAVRARAQEIGRAHV